MPVELTARRGHAMVYDEARHQVLLFGGWGTEGSQSAGDRNSLWAWDGATWTRLSATGPSPRYETALAYRRGTAARGALRRRDRRVPQPDGAFRHLGMGRGQLGEGGRPAVPVPGSHQSMAYDRARHRTVLYGGFSLAYRPGTARHLGVGRNQLAAGGGVGAFHQHRPRGCLRGEDRAVAPFLRTIRTLRPAWPTPGTERDPDPVRRSRAGLHPGFPGAACRSGRCRVGLLTTQYCDASGTMETWRFDGAGVEPACRGPSPGRGAITRMAYDRDRGRVVFFGGEPLQPGAEFRRYLGVRWHDLAAQIGLGGLSGISSRRVAPAFQEGRYRRPPGPAHPDSTALGQEDLVVTAGKGGHPRGLCATFTMAERCTRMNRSAGKRRSRAGQRFPVDERSVERCATLTQ